MTKFVVTITPPTPNGDLHIGHMAGPFLSADLFTRAQKMRGHDCVLLSYSDDYQSYMLRKGIELSTDPKEIAVNNTKKILKTLEAADINIDHWHRPQDNRYFFESVQRCYDAVNGTGSVAKKKSLEPYCSGCDVWGYEAFGRGDCNYCGVDSDASQCENCAQEPQSKEMKNFHCKLCGGKHKFVEVDREFLELSAFESTLKAELYDQKFRYPLKDWLDDTIETKLHDWGITRPEDGGLDLLPDGSRRIHTWFMGLAGYIAAFNEWSNKNRTPSGSFKEYFGQQDSCLVHFLGFDCVFSHAIVYPIIKSSMPEIEARQIFFPNQFMTLDGLNLSTSRGHTVWMRDLISASCSNSSRLYLSIVAPEEGADDFSMKAFLSWRENVYRPFSEIALTPCVNPLENDIQIEDLAAEYKRAWQEATSRESFSAKKLSILLEQLIKMVIENDRQKHHQFKLVVLIAILGKPVFPDLSSKIFVTHGLNEEELVTNFIQDGKPFESLDIINPQSNKSYG